MDGGSKKRVRPDNAEVQPLEKAVKAQKSVAGIDASVVAALQASVAAQIAAASQRFPTTSPVESGSTASSSALDTRKKAEVHVLRLDAQGREVDEGGNIVHNTFKPALSSVANQRAAKKAKNPYLAHRGDAEDAVRKSVIDDRIVSSSRKEHGKKALRFFDAGELIERQTREQERLRARHVVGRHHPEMMADEASDSTQALQAAAPEGSLQQLQQQPLPAAPPALDAQLVPALEWWDVDFLPLEYRKSLNLRKEQVPPSLEELQKTKHVRDSHAILSQLDLKNCRTRHLIQHPSTVQPLKPDAEEAPLPMHLTKKERKKIRTQKRMANEQERRDKQMMGLIPAPEPKFKLSNFMRILGDQAIADPSLVEKKVIEQMRKRELKHEMDNLARKLTPAQRYEKKVTKLRDATTKAREFHVAVFAVNDLDAPRLRYKVDVNAQSWLLTGTALLCQQGRVNLVLVEGGPRAVRRYIRLMMHRINWGNVLTDAERTSIRSRSNNADKGVAVAVNIDSEATLLDLNTNAMDVSGPAEDLSDDGAESQSDSENENDDAPVTSHTSVGIPNKCRLVWSGVSAKRNFPDFKFRECRTQAGALRLLEGHFLHPYWALAVQEEADAVKDSK